jgi:hypothetical protein
MDGAREEVLRRLPWLLGERLAEVERAQELLRDAVRDLVLAGYSWADVGRMLGVSRQAARQRFGADVEWWREHMGDRMPWDEWADGMTLENPAEVVDSLLAYERVLDSGPVEDLR